MSHFFSVHVSVLSLIIYSPNDVHFVYLQISLSIIRSRLIRLCFRCLSLEFPFDVFTFSVCNWLLFFVCLLFVFFSQTTFLGCGRLIELNRRWRRLIWWWKVCCHLSSPSSCSIFVFCFHFTWPFSWSLDLYDSWVFPFARSLVAFRPPCLPLFSHGTFAFLPNVFSILSPPTKLGATWMTVYRQMYSFATHRRQLPVRAFISAQEFSG